MKIIFQIDGGIGKSIAATAVCKAIKTQYPKDELVVITAYPDVFLGNPNVDMKLSYNDRAYFYQNHIEGKHVKMCLHNPYVETDFIAGKGHLIRVWCEMFGIRYNGEQPELFLNNREMSFFSNLFQTNKPLFVIQTNGGVPEQPNKYSWTRDLPLSAAQRIVNAFADQYHIVHIRRDDQLALQNTTPIQQEFRALATLIAMSEKRLLIDSFAQHTAAALGKPSVVCWIGNTPEQFGYDIHANIVANSPTRKPELRHSVYSEYNIAGEPTEFPYNNEEEIFDISKIVVELNDVAKQTNRATLWFENNAIRERILNARNAKWMVAYRLVWLLGKENLSSIRQILDIGSCHLHQSIEFAGIFQDARIDAFEPVPDSYQVCLQNLDNLPERGKNRIKLHNIALSNSVGEIPFFAVDPEKSSYPNVGASSMFKFIDGLNGTPFGQELIQNEIKVQTDTLDNWCVENGISEVDIMWIDVQGAELLVFQGAENILKNTRIIMTEVGLKPYYEGHTMKTDIDVFLANHGFRELEGSFELNGFDYEANTIYVRA